MTLELNRRMIFRLTGNDMAMLYDQDSRKVISLNRTGAQIYQLLLHESDSEKVITSFAGSDPERHLDAENFLAMLQQAGCLAGFTDTVSVPPAAAVRSSNISAERFGIGFSMSGTFENGDKLDICECDPEKLRRGDVICFTNRDGRAVGHRIIGGKPGKWITMGDNNDLPDRHFVTARDNIKLITGKTHLGKYYPLPGGNAGMRHFYLVQFRRRSRIFLLRGMKMAFLPLSGIFFWRKKADKSTNFGRIIQYSRRGKVIGWRINGRSVYAGYWLRLFYRLPEK